MHTIVLSYTLMSPTVNGTICLQKQDTCAACSADGCNLAPGYDSVLIGLGLVSYIHYLKTCIVTYSYNSLWQK